MTFGYGYRDCMGQSLAMKTLYILFGQLILNYEFYTKIPFKFPSNWEDLNSVPKIGISIKKRK